ncbi:ABC transporter permease [Alicyclobacillus cycloheptanicus]|uniref:Peptide/nickel transport system permease protein n=1 Tax=Alicyclobacillus cycloheptanicus TaxID=1457 RepID=A0ABT9XHU5_9BACL|nr:ABC transporter permease [Alicyclobacillus cycloheptanicus]MDQ0189882.1 peptide/nickel transport system permease protein [Alicyclobacillus cycloheptanicus]WDM02213.1 ABC transporter permease [Alicyclobacillus cycloheptanicus]
MWWYVLKRILQAIVSILGVSTIVFFILHLSSNPVLLMVPPNASAHDIAVLTHSLGLDKPLWVQYLNFLRSLSEGNLGYSYVQSQPALSILLQRLPFTLELACTAFVLSLVIGIPIGMLTAFFRGTWIERLLMPLVLIGQSMPAFWTGILLILLMSVVLKWLPSSGAGGIQSLVLPAVTLASLSMATIARMTRSSFIEELDKEYVKTARSKGAKTFRIMVQHIMRNASIPIVTIVGLEIANLFGGSVVTETIFAWPGVGALTIQSITARDFPVVQAIVLFVSIVYIVINLITELLYVWIDPRIQLGGAKSV